MANLLKFLQILSPKIIVPQAVATEIQAYGIKFFDRALSPDMILHPARSSINVAIFDEIGIKNQQNITANLDKLNMTQT